MKKYLSETLITLLIYTSFASAEALPADVKIAHQCYSQIVKSYPHAPDMQTRLKNSTLMPSTIRLDRYDEKIGNQHIASEVTALLQSKGETVGQILCLTENDKILYHYFFLNQK